MFERGKIILVPFPFTDLSSSKVRPALIISDPRYHDNDLSVLFISSKVSKEKKTDYSLKENQPHFSQTGLKVSSIIKCQKIATLDRRIVLGELGELHANDQKEVDKKIRLALGL